MGFLRTLCGLVAASAGIFYLTSASSLSDNGSWTLIGITFGAHCLGLLGGRGVKPSGQVTSAQPAIVTESINTESESDDASGADVPLLLPLRII